MKVKDDYSTKLTFETNEKLNQCRMHWDVAVVGKFNAIEENIKKILSDKELDFLEFIKKT